MCANAVYGRARPRRNPGCRVLLFLILPIVGFGASGQEPVRKVDFSQTPEVKELAEHARQIGNQMYPKVVALLGDGTTKLPKQFDIVFRKNLSRPEELEYPEGEVRTPMGTTIYLDAELIAAEPERLNRLLVHEMAHVAQRYSRSVPGYWWEGMAEYACFKLGMDGTNCPVCGYGSWHYRSGYACAAAFLVYVEKMYGSNAVRQLNSDFRRHSYSDEFFAEVTGRSLNQLWADFQKTDGYTPGAAAANRFFESKGYIEGKPPKAGDMLAQLKRQPGGALTVGAEEFVSRLAGTHQLPGFRKGENAMILAPATGEAPTNDSYPVSRRFDTSRGGQPFVYNYLVVRASRHSDWKLERIWRTGRDGKLLEEYPVP